MPVSRPIIAGGLLAMATGWALSTVTSHAYSCRTDPATDAICGNPEFQSCLIDVSAPDMSSGRMATAPRHYCIHVPEVFEAAEMPVVFGFHGGRGNGGDMVSLWEKHTEQGMVLVFPSALLTRWHTPGALTGRDCYRIWRVLDEDRPHWEDFGETDAGCDDNENDDENDDDGEEAAEVGAGSNVPHGHDLAMVDAIAEHIVAQGVVPQGFYAAGFSSGASMVRQLFITERSARMFDGFATVGNGITGPQIDAVRATGHGPYQPNTGIRKPILIAAGTSDKSYVPWESFIESIERAQEDGRCERTMSTASEFRFCYRSIDSYADPDDDNATVNNNAMVNAVESTLRWFVRHNASAMPAIESLYPDIGHGTSFGATDDMTLVVRQDFRSDPQVAGSAAVTGITIVNGRHIWPGPHGSAPPCGSRNCDIDFSEVVLQFWRANAGLEAEWP